jgi:hypothetical protein
MADVVTTNVRTQVGVESAHGTKVSATKILESFSVEPAIKSSNTAHRAQGRKHSAVVTQGRESMEFKVSSGEADFAELVYPFSSVFGDADISTPMGGTNSRLWVFTPPLSGNTAVKTLTFEKGDDDRGYRFGYGLFTGVSLKFTRDSVDFSGDGIGQLIEDDISLTGSLAPVGLSPILGDMLNYYIDDASDDLGQTQLLDVMEASFDFTGAYGEYWPMVRANSSFASHVDMAPKCEVKLTMQANDEGMSLLDSLRDGSKHFLRIEAVAPVAIEGSIHPTLYIDLCGSVSGVEPYSDRDGVYSVGWTFEGVEDTDWGQALQVSLINTLTAL